jgi:hypothetical protein
MARLGELKPCAVCGGVAILRIVQPSIATLGWVDDCSIPYDVPPLLMWECEDCHERQTLRDQLEP